MAIVIVDTSDLIELREELDNIIHQADMMNIAAKARIQQFHALGLEKDIETKILDSLFSEVKP